MGYFLQYLENQFSHRRRTSPPTPLRNGKGSLTPPSLVGKAGWFHTKKEKTFWI